MTNMRQHLQYPLGEAMGVSEQNPSSQELSTRGADKKQRH